MGRGKFGPMVPNQMGNIMKQVQKMQKELEKSQEELNAKIYEASAGGGAVKIKMNGKKEIVKLHLDKEVVDPNDIDMLVDLITIAYKEVTKEIDDESDRVVNKMGGSIPGLF